MLGDRGIQARASFDALGAPERGQHCPLVLLHGKKPGKDDSSDEIAKQTGNDAGQESQHEGPPWRMG
jgi:hypothetical protein